MKIFKNEALTLLNQGEVIGIPTDTVYGLAVLPNKKKGIKKLYDLKKRPKSNPLVLMIGDKNDLHHFVSSIPRHGNELMDAFWPGPLTIIFNDKASSTIAIRIPNHNLILDLLKESGPLLVTSLNISGSPPLETMDEIEKTFGSFFPVLDGDLPIEKKASTIIKFENNRWAIVRCGPLSEEDLSKVLGYCPKKPLTFSLNSA